ncbi:LysR family transcriptional regulator [Pasteurella bettyae]|uniref:LysR family transcriptional regulator n=1 Tax=Pasteurella bettyae TaxID=752 RepID=UPI003D2E7142
MITHFDDLHLFITIVENGSFTKASDKLGVSKFALSQSITNLEKRLNIRLLNRTTRSVSPTPEGLTLYNDIVGAYSAIGLGLQKLAENQENIVGTVRINASQLAIDTVILPKLTALLTDYPLISLEIHSDNSFVDIVEQGFDMGVRFGDAVVDDMVAVRIPKPVKTALVATPQYLQNKNIPKNINELENHQLINIRLGLDKSPISWDFKVNGQLVEYLPKSQITLNINPLTAIKNHLGIGFVARSQVENELQSGELIEILGEFADEYEPFLPIIPAENTILGRLKWC